MTDTKELVERLHKATQALYLELPSAVADDFTDTQQAAIESLEARIEELEDVLEDLLDTVNDLHKRNAKLERAVEAADELYDAADSVNKEERGDPIGMLSFTLFKYKGKREALTDLEQDDE